MIKSSYAPFSRLIEAAKNLMENSTDGGHIAAMKQVLADLEDAGVEQAANASAIERARGQYATDDVEIDDEPLVSISDKGVWVSAWVYVENDSEA